MKKGLNIEKMIAKSIISKAKSLAKIGEIEFIITGDEVELTNYCKDIINAYKWAEEYPDDIIGELSVIMAYLVDKYWNYGSEAIFKGLFDSHFLKIVLNAEELDEWTETIWKLIGDITASEYSPIYPKEYSPIHPDENEII